MRVLSRKNVTVITTILFGTFLISYFIVFQNCDYQTHTWCWSAGVTGGYALWFAILLSPVVLTLPFSVLAFEHWKKFGIFAIPVVILLSYYIDSMSGGGGVGVVGFHPGLILLPVLYGFYFFVSFAIIIVTAVRERRKRKQN